MSFNPGTEKESVRRLQQQIRNHEEVEEQPTRRLKILILLIYSADGRWETKWRMGWGSRRQPDSRAGQGSPETKPRLCQESRPPDKAGAKAGLRVGQELSQRVGIRSK